LDDHDLDSMFLLNLSGQVRRAPLTGHIIDGDVGSFLGELDADHFAQTSARNIISETQKFRKALSIDT
jgi:hypothetical protein